MPTVAYTKWAAQPAATVPSLLISTSSLPNGAIGSVYSAVLTALGGNGPYVWSLLSAVPNTGAWASLSSSGTLTGTPSTPEVETLLAQVIDSNGTKASRFLSLTVTGTPLSISTNSPLPAATNGTAYSFTMTAAGGVTPYTWSILSDTPDTGSWLSISSAGVLSGTPHTVEVETVVIQVQDHAGATVSKSFSLTVKAVPLSITTTSPLPSATVGAAYAATMFATGGVTPYTWAITSDTPDTGSWLSINASTGALSGTPTTAETESLTIQVTDSMSTIASAPFNLTVNSTSSFTFAPNLPAGYTKIWDRQWDPTDSAIPGGVLPPASLTGTDSYAMTWQAGDGQSHSPLINTVANINAALGSATVPVPITTPPDGHPNVLAIVYPQNYPFAQLPFDLFKSGTVSFKRMYAAFLVWMPSAFNSSGNNIKWLGVGGNSAFNHIFMLSSGATTSDGRSAWMTLQGNVSNNMGGSSGTLPSVVSLAVPPPQGTTVGWWSAMRDQWVMVEYLVDVVNGFFMSWVTPFGKPTFLVNNFQGVNFGTSVLEASSFIPYYGGGGGSAPAQEAIIVARSCAYGSN